MSNHTHSPSDPRVTDSIHTIWQVDQYCAFETEYIVPKGVVEVIFNFSDSGLIPIRMNNREYQMPLCTINGFNTAPIEIKLPKHQVFFGVLLQPLAVKKIFGSPASEFSDLPIDLSLIDPTCHSLWHQLAEQKSFYARVAIIEEWVANRLLRWLPQEQMINHFLYATGKHELSVSDLASELCYSSRHLARKINEATGMNTEEILLYKKYLHAVQLMHHTQLPLTSIAYESQFSDQSHFIRSFKNFANITPGEYRRNKGHVQGHLYKDVR